MLLFKMLLKFDEALIWIFNPYNYYVTSVSCNLKIFRNYYNSCFCSIKVFSIQRIRNKSYIRFRCSFYLSYPGNFKVNITANNTVYNICNVTDFHLFSLNNLLYFCCYIIFFVYVKEKKVAISIEDIIEIFFLCNSFYGFKYSILNWLHKFNLFLEIFSAISKLLNFKISDIRFNIFIFFSYCCFIVSERINLFLEYLFLVLFKEYPVNQLIAFAIPEQDCQAFVASLLLAYYSIRNLYIHFL